MSTAKFIVRVLGGFWLFAFLHIAQASSLLVSYPVQNANGLEMLHGHSDAQVDIYLPGDNKKKAKAITVRPMKPSQSLKNSSASGGIMSQVLGDYLTASWPSSSKKSGSHYIEFSFAPRNGVFIQELTSMELSFFSVTNINYSGPRVWEVSACINIDEKWDEDEAISLGLMQMSADHAQMTVDMRPLGAVPAGKTVNVRVYGYQSGGGPGGLYHVKQFDRGSDVEIYGNVRSFAGDELPSFGPLALNAIPEMNKSALFCGFFALLLLFYRRF